MSYGSASDGRRAALFALAPRARYFVSFDARVRLLIARLPEALRDRTVAAAIA